MNGFTKVSVPPVCISHTDMIIIMFSEFLYFRKEKPSSVNPDQSVSCRECVYSAPLFEGLSEEELTYLSGYTSYQTFKKGASVFLRGEEILFISLLKKGLLKVHTSSHDGKEQIISLARPDDCLGLLGVFSGKHYQYSYSALEESVIFSIELSRIKYILRRNGTFGLKLIGRISTAADAIIHNAFEIRRKNLRGRIATILNDFAGNIYHSDRFDLPVSRKEIGELIGMTTENVIRIFSEYRRDGIIAINGKTITILDKERLNALEKFG